MSRDSDIFGSLQVLNLATKVSVIKTTGLGWTLPTSKPGTPQWTYTISSNDVPPDCNNLKSYQLVLGVHFAPAAAATVSTTVNTYIEVYINDVIVGSQGTASVPSGSYGMFNFQIEVDVGDVVDVYLWADVASECTIDEVYGGIGVYNVKFNDELIYLIKADPDRVPNFTGMVGTGTSPYLQNGIFSTYNIAHNIDTNPPTYYREDATTGMCDPFYSNPRIIARVETNRLYPSSVSQFIAYIEYRRVRMRP